MQIHLSSICVRHMGSMDTGLWHQLVWDLYTPLYEGRILPEPIYNPVMKKLIFGAIDCENRLGAGEIVKGGG
jgi:hypothetical protein